MVFTYTPEVDINILTHLSDKDLFSLCQVNKYAQDLCQSDYLWKDRIRNFIGDKYAEEKLEGESWRNWYLFLRRYLPDDIGDKLNLTPLQDAIRIITQENIVIIGSELYQGINLTLRKAFQETQVLVDYFMNLFRQLYTSYITDNSTSILINYGEVISEAFNYGYDSEGIELIGYLQDNIQHFMDIAVETEDLRENYYEIATTLGSIGAIDFYDDVFTKYLPEFSVSEDTEDSFISGLVQGGHNEEAKERITNFLALNEGKFIHRYLYEQLVKAAFRGNNLGILDFIETIIPKGESLTEYHRLFALNAIEAGYLEQARPYEYLLKPDQIVSFLSIKNPQIALEYLETYPVENKRNIYVETCYLPLLIYSIEHKINIIFNVDKCSTEGIVYAIKNIKGISAGETFSIAFQKGRYDLAYNLDSILDQLKFNQREEIDFWSTIILDFPLLQYKDLLIYLILKAREKVPTTLDNLLPKLKIQDDTTHNYESRLLLTEITSLDPNQLATVDYHSILEGLLVHNKLFFLYLLQI